MKIRKKTRLVNWYLDFAQRYKDYTAFEFERLSVDELVCLEDEITWNIFGVLGSMLPDAGAVYSGRGWISVPPIMEESLNIRFMAEYLWKLIDGHLLRIVQHGSLRRAGSPQPPAIEVVISPRFRERSRHDLLLNDEGWGPVDEKKELFKFQVELAYLWLYRLIHGSSPKDFRRCLNPECKKWFFNPTKKEREYCSKRCMGGHITKLRRRKRMEQLKDSIRQMYRDCTGRKMWSPERAREHIEEKYERQLAHNSRLREWWQEYSTKKNS